MFDLGMQELIVIFIVALLVFGPKKLPELGRTLGKTIAELKRSMHSVKEQMDAELHELREPLSLEEESQKMKEGKEDKHRAEILKEDGYEVKDYNEKNKVG